MDHPQKRVRFPGHIVAPDRSEKRLSVTVTVDYNQLDPTELRVEIIDNSEQSKSHELRSELFVSGDSSIRVVSAHDPNRFLIVRDFYSYTLTAKSARIEARSVEIGVGDFALRQGDSLIATFSLLPGGILTKPSAKSFHLDGRIEIDGRPVKDPYWETEIGRFQCFESHLYHCEGRSKGAAMTVTPVTTIHLKHVAKNDENLADVRKAAMLKFDRVSSGLCLASRSIVRLCEVDLRLQRTDSSGAGPEIQNLSFERFRNPPIESAPMCPLLGVSNISGKRLHALLDALVESRISTEIGTAIRYLTLSRTHDLEPGYFFCFSSLDALTTALLTLKEHPFEVAKADWKRIRAEFEAILAKPEFAHVGSYLPEMKDKLQEVKRAPMKRKIIEAATVLRVKVDDLWLRSTFPQGVGDATRIRNNLFHSASVDSYEMMHANLIRMQYLTERMILRLLKWNSKNVHHLSEFPLLNLNQS